MPRKAWQVSSLLVFKVSSTNAKIHEHDEASEPHGRRLAAAKAAFVVWDFKPRFWEGNPTSNPILDCVCARFVQVVLQGAPKGTAAFAGRGSPGTSQRIHGLRQGVRAHKHGAGSRKSSPGKFESKAVACQKALGLRPSNWGWICD